MAASAAGPRPPQDQRGPPATPTPGRPQWLARSNTAGADSRESAAARKNDRDAPTQTTAAERAGDSKGGQDGREDKRAARRRRAQQAPSIFASATRRARRTFFKVKKTTKLDGLNAVLDAQGRAATSLRFLFYGPRVRGDQTPADIDMEDGDQLDCMLEQGGL